MKYKSCFIKDNKCSEKFKEAHILSKAATMSLVHGPTKSGLQVIHLGYKSEGNKFIPTPVGWKKASAHFCFCHDHDNDLFEPIENDNILDPKNIEQLFLHTLRSFAYAYYRKKKELQPFNDLMESILDIKSTLSGFLNSDRENEDKESRKLRERFDLKFWPYESIRKDLLDILKNKSFNQMVYRTAIIGKRFPFASAGVLMAQIIDPEQKNWSIVSYDSSDPIIKPPAIILTVLPDKHDRTIVIMGALKKDQNAIMTINKFDRLEGSDLRRALNALILDVNKDNTIFNHKLWDYMKGKGYQDKIIEELNMERGLDLITQPLSLSSFDLFNPEFSCKNLNIT